MMESVVPRQTAKRKKLGPYSRAIDRGVIGWSVDGRSREGRFLAAYADMLAIHVGSPSVVQQAIIFRAAKLALHLELFDERILDSGTVSGHASNQYLAWSNSLIRALRELGLKGGQPKAPTLAGFVEANRRARANQDAAA